MQKLSVLISVAVSRFRVTVIETTTPIFSMKALLFFGDQFGRSRFDGGPSIGQKLVKEALQGNNDDREILALRAHGV
jgi:hypothetical protein